MKNKKTLIALLILVLVAAILLFVQKKVEAPLQSDSNTSEDWKQYPLDIIPGEEYPTESVEGNIDDLVTFSVLPNSHVSGKLTIQGIVKGAYFFEANILVNILNKDKELLRSSYAMAMGEWMTAGPVKFQGEIDFTGLPQGTAYIEIHNDNASGLPENDKSILIPIVIQ